MPWGGAGVKILSFYDTNCIFVSGFVLGSFYYGYMILQIPGGYFALKFGGTRIFGWGILAASLLTIITPPVARASVWALVTLRILEGLVLVCIDTI